MFELLPWPGDRRRTLRILLFVIILATTPLYCLGFVLWGVAPGARPTVTATASATLRPATATPTRTPTPFRRVIVTSTRPLPPTPRQFRPPQQVRPVEAPAQPPAEVAQPPAPAPAQPPVVQSTAVPTATVVPVQEAAT